MVYVSLSDGSQIIAEVSHTFDELQWSWQEFIFNNIEVTPGQTYYIMVSAPYETDFCFWAYSLIDRYPYGNAWQMENFVLTSLAPYDFCFKTYGKDNQDDELDQSQTYVGSYEGIYAYWN